MTELWGAGGENGGEELRTVDAITNVDFVSGGGEAVTQGHFL